MKKSSPCSLLKKARKKHVCPFCGKSFIPHVRVGNRQKTCADLLCRKENHARYLRKWRRNNPEAEKQNRKKRTEIMGQDYWKKWRSRHPDYVLRNKILSKKRIRKLRRCLQRKRDIWQLIESKE